MKNKIVGTMYNIQHHLLIIKPNVVVGLQRGGLSGRAKISEMSSSSRNRLRRYLRNSIADYKYMQTLTYGEPFPEDGQVVKADLKRYLQEIKRYSDRHGADMDMWSMFWVLEFQARGAPHFHVLATDTCPKDVVASIWYRVVGSEDKRHLQAGTRVESIRCGKWGIASYMTKYLSKSDQKEVPEEYQNVGRFWGVTGLKSSVSAATVVPDSNKKKGAFLDKEMTKFQSLENLEILLSLKVKEILIYGRGFELDTPDNVLCLHLREGNDIEFVTNIVKRMECLNAGINGVVPKYFMPENMITQHNRSG